MHFARCILILMKGLSQSQVIDLLFTSQIASFMCTAAWTVVVFVDDKQ